MDSKLIVPGELYAYVEYPKNYAHVSAQPNPIKVIVEDVIGDRVTMRRHDGRKFLVGSAMVEEHTVGSRKIICAWDELERAREAAAAYAREQRDAWLDSRAERAREVEDVLQYFDGIDGLEERLQTAFVRNDNLTVELSRNQMVAVGKRIRELQALAAQNALDESDLEGWTQ